MKRPHSRYDIMMLVSTCLDTTSSGWTGLKVRAHRPRIAQWLARMQPHCLSLCRDRTEESLVTNLQNGRKWREHGGVGHAQTPLGPKPWKPEGHDATWRRQETETPFVHFLFLYVSRVGESTRPVSSSNKCTKLRRQPYPLLRLRAGVRHARE